jgi:hypothetical protein
VDVNAALQTQIRKPLEHWFRVIDASGLQKHSDVVALLKASHGLAHGAAHRIGLLARNRRASPEPGTPADPVNDLYSGAKAAVKPLHDAVITLLQPLGAFEIAPKKGYLSLRRRKQFAMLQPTTTGRLDVGLVLPPGTSTTSRLESASGFNALFTHRVRITDVHEVDTHLRSWLKRAFDHAG